MKYCTVLLYRHALTQTGTWDGRAYESAAGTEEKLHTITQMLLTLTGTAANTRALHDTVLDISYAFLSLPLSLSLSPSLSLPLSVSFSPPFSTSSAPRCVSAAGIRRDSLESTEKKDKKIGPNENQKHRVSRPHSPSLSLAPSLSPLCVCVALSLSPTLTPLPSLLSFAMNLERREREN